jgi:hypothetical protein
MEKQNNSSILRKPPDNRALSGRIDMETPIRHITPPLGNVRVVLNYGPLGFVRAITDYIDHGTMRVNTGSITLNHHAEVEIVLSIPGARYNEHHRIAAQVSHCGEGGMSTLSFLGCDEVTRKALLPYLSLNTH